MDKALVYHFIPGAAAYFCAATAPISCLVRRYALEQAEVLTLMFHGVTW